MTRMWWKNQATKQWVCEEITQNGADARRVEAQKQLRSFMTDVKSNVYMDIHFIATPWGDAADRFILHTPTTFYEVSVSEVPAEIKLMKLLTEDT